MARPDIFKTNCQECPAVLEAGSAEGFADQVVEHSKTEHGVTDPAAQSKLYQWALNEAANAKMASG